MNLSASEENVLGTGGEKKFLGVAAEELVAIFPASALGVHYGR